MYSIQSISSTAKVIRRLKLALKELSVEDVSQGMEELQRLRAFAQAVMESWPDDDVEGGHLQSMAVTHGLLVEITRQEPCGDGCRCAETEHEEDWRDGVRCFRKTPLLIGLTKEVT